MTSVLTVPFEAHSTVAYLRRRRQIRRFCAERGMETRFARAPRGGICTLVERRGRLFLLAEVSREVSEHFGHNDIGDDA